MKRIRFIANPNSGPHFDPYLEHTVGLLADRNKVSYDYCFTRGPKDGKRLAQEAVDAGYEAVVAVGGDGTIHEIAGVLAHTQTALGILPKGSGNGLAFHLGIPMNPQNAIRVIFNLKTDSIDTVILNKTRFVNIAGFGFEAEIAHRFASSKKRGLLNYTRLVINTFRSSKTYHWKTIGMDQPEPFWQLTIANGSQYGNQVTVSPTSNLQDGLFEVHVLQKPQFMRAIQLVYFMLRGKQNPRHKVKSVQNLNFVLLDGAPGHADGEIFGGQETQFNLNIDPKSLRIITP